MSLRIIVAIKQVPDTDDLRIDPVTNNLVREGVPAVTNPPDLHAIEEAIRLRERYGGKVIVITMGPPQAEEALREAIAMGADEAYLITDRAMAGADTWATSYTLYKAIKKIGEADIYLFGRRAVDGETEQVGPQTGRWLGIPSVGYVSKFVDIDLNAKRATVIRTTENEEEEIRVPLPAAFSVLETINEPRQPDIDSLIKAKMIKIPRLSKDDIQAEPNKIGLAGSPTKVIKVQPPPRTRNPEIYKGKAEDAAQWIYDKIIKSLEESKQVLESYQKPQPIAKVNGEVWVYIDHFGEEVNRVSLEILSEGRRIADLLSTKLAGVIVGDQVDHIIKDLFNYGVDKVYYARTKGFPFYVNDVYTRALATLIRKYKPEVIFFPGTRNSRELASTTAIEVNTGLAADCTKFDVDAKGLVYATRPDFGGKELSTIICPNNKPFMITVRGGIFAPIRIPKGEGEVITEEIEDLSTRFEILRYTKLQKRNILTEADIVVGVGRGIKSPENIKLAEELASLLRGVVGVTKPLADAGWYPKERQIGQTGTSIRPKLYIALGISGAIQHVVGISGARRIIAVNIDPEAPIFEHSDYGVVGDLFEIIPELIKIIKERGVPT